MQADREAEILKRLSEGDERALEEVMLRYRDNVFEVARRFVRSRDLAVEITQEVFITIWLQRKNFANSTDIGGYCRILTRNITLTHFRKLHKQNAVQYEFLLSHLDQPKDIDAEPDLLDRYSEGLLETCIEKLAPQQKLALRLRQPGANYNQIAEQMNISAHTVKYHLHEARATMRNLLREHHLPLCIFILTQTLY